MKPIILIDEPTPFSTMEHWQSYLAEMKNIKEIDVTERIKKAEKYIAAHRSGGMEAAIKLHPN